MKRKEKKTKQNKSEINKSVLPCNSHSTTNSFTKFEQEAVASEMNSTAHRSETIKKQCYFCILLLKRKMK